MEKEINVLIILLITLIQRRCQGIRMTSSEKARFISSLFQYATQVLDVKYNEKCIENSGSNIFCIKRI